ncbi:hypothetical protein RFI_29146 [Reticulomyxa filosa]|uniref:Uncharacterized protein n=1 Tax=Reticulomyxa filosa TaxID=46433 RepID=X6M5E4_RETFI|nr:hypothetical protein RFI_29146 [Reticulomyxa filosa]|eukprot:ETO08250.1 hypothetical protein RFI_29146 [Reticulomyxa filosa]
MLDGKYSLNYKSTISNLKVILIFGHWIFQNFVKFWTSWNLGCLKTFLIIWYCFITVLIWKNIGIEFVYLRINSSQYLENVYNNFVLILQEHRDNNKSLSEQQREEDIDKNQAFIKSTQSITSEKTYFKSPVVFELLSSNQILKFKNNFILTYFIININFCKKSCILKEIEDRSNYIVCKNNKQKFRKVVVRKKFSKMINVFAFYKIIYKKKLPQYIYNNYSYKQIKTSKKHNKNY